jgi:hypothetical protein
VLCRIEEKGKEYSYSVPKDSDNSMLGLFSEEKCKRWRQRSKDRKFQQSCIDKFVSVKEKEVTENRFIPWPSKNSFRHVAEWKKEETKD